MFQKIDLLETLQNKLDKNKLHPNKQIKLMQTGCNKKCRSTVTKNTSNIVKKSKTRNKKKTSFTQYLQEKTIRYIC